MAYPRLCTASSSLRFSTIALQVQPLEPTGGRLCPGNSFLSTFSPFATSTGARPARGCAGHGSRVRVSCLPLQSASASDRGQRATSQQLAAADRSMSRMPNRVAAPHSELVKEGVASRLGHDGAVLEIPAGALTADTTLSITPLGACGPGRPSMPGLAITTRVSRAGYRMGPPGAALRPVRSPSPCPTTGRGCLGDRATPMSGFELVRRCGRSAGSRSSGSASTRGAQTVTARTDHFTISSLRRSPCPITPRSRASIRPA